MIYSTLLSGSQGGSAASGSNYNAPSAIVIDSLGHAYIDGETNSTDFPTTARRGANDCRRKRTTGLSLNFRPTAAPWCSRLISAERL